MLLLDWPLGLVVLASLIPLLRGCPAGSGASPPAPTGVPGRRSRLVIVHFVETFGGIRAVQAFRREQRNDEIFAGLNDDYRRRQHAGVPAARHLRPGHHADRQRHHRPSCSRTAATGSLDGDLEVGVLAAFLLYLQRFFDPMQEVSQFYNSSSRRPRRWRRSPACWTRTPRCPSPSTPVALADAAAAAGAFDRVEFGYRGRPVVLPELDLRHPGRADRRAGRRDRRRQDDDRPAARRASTTRPRARSASTASTCATLPTTTCAGES